MCRIFRTMVEEVLGIDKHIFRQSGLPNIFKVKPDVSTISLLSIP